MRFPPLNVIASWPPANYVNPVTRGKTLLIVNTLLLSVATVVLLMRLWARWRLVKSLGLDDLLISIAWVPNLGLAVAVLLAADKYGWDRHIWDIPFNMDTPSRQVSWAAQFLFVVDTSLVKISILLFYKRIADGSYEKSFLYIVWGSITFCIMYMIAFILVLLVGCMPLHKYWDLNYVGGHCFDEGISLVVSAIVSLLTDFLVITLPIVLVSRMQLPRRQKITLCVIFGFGFVACAAGLMRTIYMYKVLHQTYDVTWWGYPMWTWAAVEADLGIICASAPALKPFFKKYLVASYDSAFGRSKNVSNKPVDQDETPINSRMRSQKGGARADIHELRDVESHYHGRAHGPEADLSGDSLTRYNSSGDSSSIPEFGKDGTHHESSSV